MSKNSLHFTALFPLIPTVKISKPTYLLHTELSAHLAKLNSLFLTGGMALSNVGRTTLEGLQSLGHSLADYPEELIALKEDEAILQYMKAVHQLAQPKFWETLSQQSHHPETVLQIANRWLGHGGYAHYTTDALLESYYILEESRQQIQNFQKVNKTDVPPDYKNYLRDYLSCALTEQKNVQAAVFHRVTTCLQTGNRKNPSQFTFLENLFKQQQVLPPKMPSVPGRNHSFPLISALTHCFKTPVFKKELEKLLWLPNKDALVLVQQDRRSILAPATLVPLIPATPSRWFSWVGRRHRQFCYDWPAQQEQLLLDLVALPHALKAPVTWDVQDRSWAKLDSLSADVDSVFNQLNTYKAPRFFYADTKKFIAQTTVFCVEQKNIILDKKIERLEAILKLPTPPELERVVDTELDSFIEPIAKLIEKVKDEALALQRSESLLGASHRWGDRITRLGNLEAKIKRAALPRDLWLNLKKLTSAIEQKTILPKSVFDDLMLQLSLKDALHQPTMQALQDTIAPRIEAAVIDALDTWTHYFENPDADELPTISLLNQYLALTNKLSNVSGIRINHDDLLEPLERAITSFKTYCKGLNPDDMDKDQVVFLNSVVKSLNSGITKLPDFEQRKKMYYLTEDIEQYLECLNVGVLPTTRTELFEQQEQQQFADNQAKASFIADANLWLEQFLQRQKSIERETENLGNFSLFRPNFLQSNAVHHEEKSDDSQCSPVLK